MKRLSLLTFALFALFSISMAVAQSTETQYTTTAARMRACPYLTCTVVNTLPTGTAIEIVGSEDGARVNGSVVWYEVEVDGRTGYVHSSLTTERAPAAATPSRSTTTTTSRTQSSSSAVTVTPEPSTQVTTPAVQEHPPGATAICRNGTYSYSQNRRGTCSHNGGVAQWLR